jgi:UDP-N-acetylglucosamine acyltransferase
MNNFIHNTAIVHENAKIGQDNYIGPYCIIGPNVKMGDGNRLEAFVTIGTPAEHRDYFTLPPGPVLIGDKNIFREYVTVNGGSTGITEVKNQCTLLRGSHVGHDASVHDFVNLGCNVALGGHSIIDVGANLGLSTVVHQFRIVGAYTMIGMNSTVTRDVIPFTLSFGSPAEAKRLNRIGLQRAGITLAELNIFENWFEEQNQHVEVVCSINHFYNKFIQDYFGFKNREKSQKSA